ncbi:MAG: 2-oxoglutarate dehydrogenase E1 subunit family protein, partial [Rhodospirillaceae bacterium]
MDPTFLTGANATFVAELYAQFIRDPSSVDPSWSSFFRDLCDEAGDLLGELDGASWAPSEAAVIGVAEEDAAAAKKGKSGSKGAPVDQASLIKQTEDSIHALQMIRAYRARGHQIASLDPLALQKQEPHPELDPKVHGFDEADMDREIYLGGVMGMDKATPRHMLQILKDTYCGTIGVEFT